MWYAIQKVLLLLSVRLSLFSLSASSKTSQCMSQSPWCCIFVIQPPNSTTCPHICLQKLEQMNPANHTMLSAARSEQFFTVRFCASSGFGVVSEFSFSADLFRSFSSLSALVFLPRTASDQTPPTKYWLLCLVAANPLKSLDKSVFFLLSYSFSLSLPSDQLI